MDRSDDRSDAVVDTATVRTGPVTLGRGASGRAACDGVLAESVETEQREYLRPDVAFTLPPARDVFSNDNVNVDAGSPDVVAPPIMKSIAAVENAPAVAVLGGLLPLSATPSPVVADASYRARSHWRDIALKTLRYAAIVAACWLALVGFLIVVFRFANPPMSSLMIQQWLLGQGIRHTWVSIENISPQIVRAVIVSEDGRFCQHSGVDFIAMQDAIERARDGIPRGASTISMQVTKNLFLWPSKSYLRKAIEIPLTWAIELVWPKRRIMEVYLNIAEWGPGIFGVEAASRFHFDKASARLNEREAAQLAVALPNPISRDAGDPGPRTRRLASDIQSRMRNTPPGQLGCVLRRAVWRF